MDRVAFFKNCVVVITSNDYESFEIILNDTQAFAAERGVQVTEPEVAEALRSAIDNGLVEAFILSPQRPQAVKVAYSPDQLYELWYRVTSSGKNMAEGITLLSDES